MWNCTSASPVYLTGVYRNNFIVFLSFCCSPLATCYVATFKSILQLPSNIFLHHSSLFCVLLRKLAQNRKASVIGSFMSRPEHRLLWLIVPWFSRGSYGQCRFSTLNYATTASFQSLLICGYYSLVIVLDFHPFYRPRRSLG